MVRNILGVIVGLIVGSLVNISLIMVNLSFLPTGADFTTPEGVNAVMQNLKPINFVIVFLAHALGALVGAFVTSLIAVSHKNKLALLIGVLFLLGGIYNAVVIEAPLWFEAVDIIFAYIPTAWIAGKLATSGKA